MSKQKDAFLSGEADSWFERNLPGFSKAQPELEDLKGFFEPGARVLEIGCSGGRYSSFFMGRGASFVGIDPSEKAIQAARHAYEEGEFHLGTADKLPFDNESFDLIFFSFCLYVIDRPLLAKVVSEADRVLKNKGFLAILDFEPPFPSQRPYAHVPGLISYKMDYGKIFLSFPHYVPAFKRVFSHRSDALLFEAAPQERTSLQILFKDHASSYHQQL